MVRYAAQLENPSKSALARSEYTRTHFKNSREVCHAIKGMNLHKALAYLEAVKEHKRAIPFTRFHGGIGRTAQGKEFGTSQARWPVKTAQFVIQLLKNVESNADDWTLIASSLNIFKPTKPPSNDDEPIG
ncbi:60S ribosomal protein L17-A [Neolecta irregularis DAH-3]|uniref:60S ribosomal protein L17-A n=1 Tax=Neolecta irregularis (strain DAH-3) TaxID=1198029 RepID=A0A1U7LRK0_NEOID|nr:60S ribosomal protein L17-A [Neolecta irregularis DAH-3]|eukprot:OLL25300.1 60S ribosomal protein L17-A [Neolecta irregularis DAH-3]